VTDSAPTQSQLRIYRLKPDTLPRFLDVWRTDVLPLRRRHGFEVRGAWYSEASNEFVWMLSYAGLDGFAAADARYYASPERQALPPARDPAQFIASRELRILVDVPVPVS
jgi:hypothetical protein